jgi:hypothetical protein
MFIAIVAVAAIIAAGVWTGLDRSTARAIAGSLGCGAVLSGFAVMLGGEDAMATVLRCAAAMAGSIVGIVAGLVLKSALAGGGQRLMVSDGGPTRTAKPRANIEATAERKRIRAAVSK